MPSWFCHGSGIIISTACGSDRPAITRNSSTLSNIAVSLPAFADDRQDLLQIVAEDVGLEQRLARLHPVDVAAERVDLAVVRDEAVGMRQRPRGKRVGAEPLVDERQRRLDVRVRQVGEHRLDLVGRQHALVDQRPRREAGHVERTAIRQRHRVHRVLDALPDDVELPLEAHVGVRVRRLGVERRTAANKQLAKIRLDRDGARPEGRIVCRHIAPAEDTLPFLGNDLFESSFDRRAQGRIAGQEDEPGAVVPFGRQREAQAGGLAPEEPVRHLDQNARAVAGVGFAAARAAVKQVDEDLQRLLDNRMRAAAFHVHDEPDAARVVLVGGIVKSLRRRQS